MHTLAYPTAKVRSAIVVHLILARWRADLLRQTLPHFVATTVNFTLATHTGDCADDDAASQASTDHIDDVPDAQQLQERREANIRALKNDRSVFSSNINIAELL